MIQLKDIKLVSGSCDCSNRLLDIKDYSYVQIINRHKNFVYFFC